MKRQKEQAEGTLNGRWADRRAGLTCGAGRLAWRRQTGMIWGMGLGVGGQAGMGWAGCCALTCPT